LVRRVWLLVLYRPQRLVSMLPVLVLLVSQVRNLPELVGAVLVQALVQPGQ
jgi:hypothetical protein